MAVAALKKLWKNEYVQMAIMVAAILGLVFGFWYGTQLVLRTDYPALAVASTSMVPTLNVGDLIIVQGTPPDQIYANYVNGDIIVFRNPSRPDELIVHRAINKELTNGVYYFTTHGDNNYLGSNEGPFNETYVVGKVVGRIPCVGNFALLMHTRENMYIFTIVIIVLIIILLMFPFETESKEKTGTGKKRWDTKKLFGRLDLKIIYLVVVNLLMVIFTVASLYGAFSFWNPGASSGSQSVTVHGMYPDVQFYERFKNENNNISGVSLSQGFLTYAISCFVSDGAHEGVRPGVPTFSWAQAAIILLVVFNTWELIKFARSRKTAETETQA